MSEAVVIENYNKELEIKVSMLLRRIGVPAHIKGHGYLRYAIIMAVENESVINSVTKVLYPGIAKHFGVSASSVERAMRNAVSIAWERGDITLLSDLFGFTIDCAKGKPTNSEFIAMLSDEIRLNREHLL